MYYLKMLRKASVRFIGGVQTLIDAIADTIPSGVVELETRVTAIRLDEDGAITVEADIANGKAEKFQRVLLF